MSVRVTAKLALTVQSPFLSKGVGAAAFGLDACLATDHAGYAILPGDQIKGLLAAALEDMATAGVKDAARFHLRLFGEKNADGEYGPQRGRIVLSDLKTATRIRTTEGVPTHPPGPTGEGGTENDLPTLGSLTRIAIEDKTGAVKSGHLQVIETPWPLGIPVDLTGTLVLFADTRDQADRAIALLSCALRLLPAVGANRSLGFGVVAEDPILTVSSVCDLLAPASTTKTPATGRVRLRLAADRPLLVDARRVADNVYQGATVIPGAVLKGALATRLDRAGAMDTETSAAVARLVFNHAHPLTERAKTEGNNAPVLPLPFSVVSDRDPDTRRVTFGDVLRCRTDGVFASGRAPLFSIDWKDAVWAQALAEVLDQKALSPRFDTRTHTEMDNTTYTSAEDKLFTWSAVVPETAPGRPLIWQVDLVAPTAVDRARLAGLVDLWAGEGLEGVGKTEATLSMDGTPQWVQEPQPEPLAPDHADMWAVTLLTPAVLTPLETLRANGEDIVAAYQAYWAAISDGALDLVTVFAAQRLAGGYQALRYRLGRPNYDPYLVTDPGSVFLLKGDGKATLQTALTSNLPLPPEIARAGATWQTFPFMPQNGFGAIALSLINHVRWAADLKGGAHAW